MSPLGAKGRIQCKEICLGNKLTRSGLAIANIDCQLSWIDICLGD
jgi:hypothetical protein